MATLGQSSRDDVPIAPAPLRAGVSAGSNLSARARKCSARLTSPKRGFPGRYTTRCDLSVGCSSGASLEDGGYEANPAPGAPDEPA